MDNTRIAAIILLLVSFIAGIVLYPMMPDPMASHWDAAGQVNGYISKFWGVFLLPIISVVMFLLLFFLPMIDPLKKNVEKFRKQYELFILFMLFFMVYIYALTIVWNLGYAFDMTFVMLPAIAFLLFYAGVMMEKSERNWFIGIKTPWTLSSDFVWKKTNTLAGKLFKLCAIITLIGLFFRSYAFAIMLAPLLAVTVFVTVYSYLLFKKEKRKR